MRLNQQLPKDRVLQRQANRIKEEILKIYDVPPHSMEREIKCP